LNLQHREAKKAYAGINTGKNSKIPVFVPVMGTGTGTGMPKKNKRRL
jgi:hypothetical protein